MSTIKNGQISLYCHFNKIIKGPGTNFQSPELNQKYNRNFEILIMTRTDTIKIFFRLYPTHCSSHEYALY